MRGGRGGDISTSSNNASSTANGGKKNDDVNDDVIIHNRKNEMSHTSSSSQKRNNNKGRGGRMATAANNGSQTNRGNNNNNNNNKQSSSSTSNNRSSAGAGRMNVSGRGGGRGQQRKNNNNNNNNNAQQQARANNKHNNNSSNKSRKDGNCGRLMKDLSFSTAGSAAAALSSKKVNNDVQTNNNGNDTPNNNNTHNQGRQNKKNKSRTKKVQYEPYTPLSTCVQHYTSSSLQPTIIRGKLRVMPSKHGISFVSCDKGSLSQDVVIQSEIDRNRALDGDFVYVELYPPDSNCGGGDEGEDDDGQDTEKKRNKKKNELSDYMSGLELNDNNAANVDVVNSHKKKQQRQQVVDNEGGDEETLFEDDVKYEEEEYLIGEEEEEEEEEELDDGDEDYDNKEGGEEQEKVEMWQDDDVQMSLWDPLVSIKRKSSSTISNKNTKSSTQQQHQQRSGKVIYILPPKSTPGQLPSEFTPAEEVDGSHTKKKQQCVQHKRIIVGTLKQLPMGGRYLLTPNNKSLPQFMCPVGTKPEQQQQQKLNTNNNNSNHNNGNESKNDNKNTLYRAEYIHGSWHETQKWPPCTNVQRLCGTCNVHDETQALLVENNVNHGDFSPAVLNDVEQSVKSGRFIVDTTTTSSSGNEDSSSMGWKPTKEMYKGRRDYRNQRIFTIDPTTAKDLDDALHITPLDDGRVEIGVHIADVSHFIPENSAVDEEALRRATTVYLVNDVIPMLPRPLCEIACSLNENVERLAFSCVWKMNMDGTLSKKKGGGSDKGGPKKDDIWYGRTVIKSCARLDYATAQNIIDNKVANGERHVDEKYWSKSRQPTGGHTIDDVAKDVRLMHKVAMARRALRFENGALALNGIKLAFQLEEDGETPKLCAPYPLRDSNRLIEEFMLLANYLVAQRLITHAGGRALLRNHSPPLESGMEQVVDVSRESFNFEIDRTNSHTLQASLSRLSRECNDPLVVQCVTESLMTPMRPAEYVAAGELESLEWAHFALNIPYYTHFTSPIRRYPDVIVHRLLQATLDDDVNEYPLKQNEIHAMAEHCNDMRMNAKKAQERSDRVFLSLFLKENPISSTLGVCLSVGEKTFTVFVPSLGLSTRVFLDEHKDEFTSNAFEDSNGRRKIIIQPKTNLVPGMDMEATGEEDACSWKSLDISVFTKLEVSCTCKVQPPIDVRVKVVAPWPKN